MTARRTKNCAWKNLYELLGFLSFDLLLKKQLKTQDNNNNNIRVFIFISIFLVFLFLYSSGLQLAFADSVISTVQLGGRPDITGTQEEIVFDLNSGNGYVVNPALDGGVGGVSVIDTQNNTVTSNITIMDIPKSLYALPREIALSPDNDNLYVSSLALLVNFSTGEVEERCTEQTSSTPCVVSVIDTQNNTVIKTIPVGVGVLPTGIAFNPDNGDMYVVNEKLNEGSKTVSVIDTQNNTVIKTIPVGNFTNDDIPNEIAFNPDNGDMYVVNEGNETVNAGNGSVSVIDTQNNTVIKTIPVGVLPTGIAFNPDNGTAYVVNQESRSVSVIDTQNNTVIKTIRLGNLPNDIAFNPDNRDMYVAGGFSNSVFAVDTQNNTVSQEIPVGEGALSIAYNPNNGNMYVTNVLDNTISVIDTVPSTTR